ncbi:hypothetical protein XM25_18795 [Devosia sp. H5989]|nr:hypothetical protein XM25_18795 [Devosia sp. H5989]
MISGIKNWLLHRGSQPGANFEPGFYAVGYPKTGNTWIRILLGRYVQLLYGLQDMPLFDQAEMHDLQTGGYQGPTGLFTHSPLTWVSQQASDLDHASVIAPFSGKRVLLLVRHPLDTLVSSFMHSKHKVSPPYGGTIEEFVSDSVHGLTKLFRFYQLWADHINEAECLLLVRYEDTHANPVAQLRRLAIFVGADVDEALLIEAAAYASFDNLKQLETEGTRFVYKSSGFNAFGDGRRDVPDAYHVRKGQVAGYSSELPAEVVDALEARVLDEMPHLYGYL